MDLIMDVDCNRLSIKYFEQFRRFFELKHEV